MNRWLSCIFVLASLYFNEVPATVETSEPLFVTAIWRHGARSSLHSFPDDPYNDKNIWPNGKGQLTQVGMRQHYELGQHFRQAYGKLLSEHYLRNETYIQSTDFDRTLMSAECNMAGLYPPKDWQAWNGSNTSWQPIPIHTDPHDKLLRYDLNNSTCQQITQKILSSVEYKNLELKYKAFLSTIGNLTNSTDPVTLRSSWNIQDTLRCEKFHNLTLPPWATKRVQNELDEIVGLDMGIMFGGINYEYREELAPYTGGPLVKQIIENMQNRIQNKATFKFIGYSAHDTTVAGLLVALEAYNWLPPPFASCVIFELYKTNTSSNDLDSYLVKAFYRNSTASPIPIKLLGCDFSCPLSQLINLANSITSMHHVAPTTTASSSVKIVLDYARQHYVEAILIMVSTLLVLTWLIVICALCRRRTPKDTYYKRVDRDYRPLASYDDVRHGAL